MHTVHGRAQHYAWGDPAKIPELLGVAADGRPWAEWWLGTHPLAPSTIDDGAALQAVAGDLPYLLKLMAAAEPLSLQTHPDGRRAEAGFAREEGLGVARDSPVRVYRDPFAKPEMLCALTSFDTLCGFRPVDATISLLHQIDAHELARFLEHDSLATVVRALYHRQFDASNTISACSRVDLREANLVTELAGIYAGDPSVVVTLLLNRVLLARGEAVFLGPGNLHAYLRGFGVEIMGNSDNVVRGGITVKHVDVDELLDVLDFEPLNDPVVRPSEVQSGRWRYETPGTPFILWRLEVDISRTMHHRADRPRAAPVGGGSTTVVSASTWKQAKRSSSHGPATVFRVEER